MKRYNQKIESQMLLYYSGLPEKLRRHYGALEAKKLGHGGKKYIGELLGISKKTLIKGERELSNPNLLEEIPPNKQRRQGGGRKKKQ